MKKILLSFCMSSLLIACTATTTREEPLSFPSEFQEEINVVPPENIQTQPDEFREKLQTFPDVPDFSNKKMKYGSYIGGLAKELRKELRRTGVQVKEVDAQINLIIPDRVAFAGNQTKILDSFDSSMSSIAKLLNKYEQTMVQIIGYTDDVSPVLMARELSLKRADEIANFLREQGIEAGRIITDGAGAENPVATNATPTGREQNRRIEITIIRLK